MECYFNCKSNKIPDLLGFIGIVFSPSTFLRLQIIPS